MLVLSLVYKYLSHCQKRDKMVLAIGVEFRYILPGNGGCMRCDLKHSHEPTFFHRVWQIWRVLRSYARNSRSLIEFLCRNSLVSYMEINWKPVMGVPGETCAPCGRKMDCLLRRTRMNLFTFFFFKNIISFFLPACK